MNKQTRNNFNDTNINARIKQKWLIDKTKNDSLSLQILNLINQNETLISWHFGLDIFFSCESYQAKSIYTLPFFIPEKNKMHR